GVAAAPPRPVRRPGAPVPRLLPARPSAVVHPAARVVVAPVVADDALSDPAERPRAVHDDAALAGLPPQRPPGPASGDGALPVRELPPGRLPDAGPALRAPADAVAADGEGPGNRQRPNAGLHRALPGADGSDRGARGAAHTGVRGGAGALATRPAGV